MGIATRMSEADETKMVLIRFVARDESKTGLRSDLAQGMEGKIVLQEEKSWKVGQAARD